MKFGRITQMINYTNKCSIFKWKFNEISLIRTPVLLGVGFFKGVIVNEKFVGHFIFFKKLCLCSI